MPNLLDRKKQEQNSNPTEQQPKSENSKGITPKSSLPSKELQLIQSLKEALETVTSERNQLLKEGRPQDRKQIQKLSSANSMLEKSLRQKSETIVSLNGKLESLNNADLTLKNAEEKERENAKKDNDLQTAASELEEEQARVDADRNRLSQDQADFYEEKAALDKTREHLQEHIEEEARSLAEASERESARKYDEKYAKVSGFYFGVLMYGLLFTLFEAITKERFREDFIEFFKAIWSFIAGTFEVAGNGFDDIYNGIQIEGHPTATVILSWTLGGLGFMVVIAIAFGTVGTACYFIGKWTYDYYWDKISLSVVLISLAVFVVFSDWIEILKWNYLACILLIYCLYMFIRFFSSSPKKIEHHKRTVS